MKLSLLLYFSKICLVYSASIAGHDDDWQAANSSRPVTAGGLRDTLLYKKIIESLKAHDELAGAPRAAVDLRENERLGPEGKIAHPLIGSINYGLGDGESNSVAKIVVRPAGILVYRPLRLPAVSPPDGDGRDFTTCYLLAAIAIAALVLLNCVRSNLMVDGRDFGASQRILYVCLTAVLCVSLTTLLSNIYFMRYYDRYPERSIDGSADLASPLTSSRDCLRRLVQSSGDDFCVLRDVLGREIIVRKMSRETGPFPSEKFDLWRSIFTGGASNDSEKLRVNQLRLMQSGILNRWNPPQTIVGNSEEDREESSGESEPEEPKEIQKFAHFVALIVIVVYLVALVVFLAERIVRRVKMRDRSFQYVVLE